MLLRWSTELLLRWSTERRERKLLMLELELLNPMSDRLLNEWTDVCTRNNFVSDCYGCNSAVVVMMVKALQWGGSLCNVLIWGWRMKAAQMRMNDFLFGCKRIKKKYSTQSLNYSMHSNWKKGGLLYVLNVHSLVLGLDLCKSTHAYNKFTNNKFKIEFSIFYIQNTFCI